MNQEAINLRNQQESPLLRLPAELRTLIYKYVLGGHNFMLYPRRGNAWRIEDEDGPISAQSGLFPIRQTCRFIHNEAINIRVTPSTFTVRETKGHSLGWAHLGLYIRGFNIRNDVKVVEIRVLAADVRLTRGMSYFRLKMITLIELKGVECIKIVFIPDVATAFGAGVGYAGISEAILMMKSEFLRARQRVEFVQVYPPKPVRLFRQIP